MTTPVDQAGGDAMGRYVVPVPGLELVREGRGFTVLDGRCSRIAHLNESAALVLDHCNGARTVGQVAGCLAAIFPDTDPSAIVPDVRHSVEQLNAAGLVELQDERCLPDFIIAGSMKSGTTTLHYNLNRHPDIHIPSNEVHYFANPNGNWKKGVGWYRRHFPRNDKVQGEKTPVYLHKHGCHQRIRELLPGVRFVLILRNPVARAYSQWNHFNTAHQKAKYGDWKTTDFRTSIDVNRSLSKNGRYVDHLEHLCRYFPRDAIHVCIAERFRSGGDREIQRVYDFLGVPRHAAPFTSRKIATYASPMPEQARQYLVEYYRPFNRRLEEFLGERIPEWED